MAFAGSVAAGPISEDYAARLADAIFHAEGGKKAKVSYGILSVKTKDPRGVCLHTIRKNWERWEAAGSPGDFIDYLGARYAPVAGDRTGLNKNWPRNVRSLLRRSE